jgi:hypothetical protein
MPPACIAVCTFALCMLACVPFMYMYNYVPFSEDTTYDAITSNLLLVTCITPPLMFILNALDYLYIYDEFHQIIPTKSPISVYEYIITFKERIRTQLVTYVIQVYTFTVAPCYREVNYFVFHTYESDNNIWATYLFAGYIMCIFILGAYIYIKLMNVPLPS